MADFDDCSATGSSEGSKGPGGIQRDTQEEVRDTVSGQESQQLNLSSVQSAANEIVTQEQTVTRSSLHQNGRNTVDEADTFTDPVHERRVLCFGDSLTAGFWSDGARFHPYAATLQELLCGVRVDHVGLSGWSTTQMVDSLDNDMCVDVCNRRWKGLRAQLADHQYTHCVILAGTNDLHTNSAQHILNNILHLAHSASSFGCETFVLTIPELGVEVLDPAVAAKRCNVNKHLLQLHGSPLAGGQTMSAIDIASLLPPINHATGNFDRIWEQDRLHLRPVPRLP